MALDVRADGGGRLESIENGLHGGGDVKGWLLSGGVAGSQWSSTRLCRYDVVSLLPD